MADEKKKGLFGGKTKEEAKTVAAAAASVAGAKVAAAAGSLGAKTTATASTAASKPTATASKPAAAVAAAAKPTASTTASKPTASKPTASTAASKPTSSAAAAAAAAASRPTSLSAKKTDFVDVPVDAYYSAPVAWAVGKGITSGITPTEFAPGNPCHRGHAATFLWRSMGSPAPKTASSPFSDVTDGPFLQAVLWASEKGIVPGTSDTTFSLKDPCTRAQVLTYLYRAKGKAGATEAEATAWAEQQGLLKGLDGGTGAPCTRADIVTFIYRAQSMKV